MYSNIYFESSFWLSSEIAEVDAICPLYSRTLKVNIRVRSRMYGSLCKLQASLVENLQVDIHIWAFEFLVLYRNLLLALNLYLWIFLEQNHKLNEPKTTHSNRTLVSHTVIINNFVCTPFYTKTCVRKTSWHAYIYIYLASVVCSSHSTVCRRLSFLSILLARSLPGLHQVI